VKNYLFSKGMALKFPDYVYVSKNYYEKSWGSKTHRRLKNVIVTMDFVPSRSALQEVAAGGKPFSANQEKMLKRAFSGADNSNTGTISIDELKEVLKAVDVDVDGEDGDKFFEKMPELKNRAITFDDLKQLMEQRLFYRVQAGRYYVVLSLFEAECMRAVMHQQVALPLIPGKDTAVALRTGRTMLDATYGYQPAQSFQDSTAQSCYRFIDSDLNYQPREVSLLLRALQENDLEKRYNFFVEVRSNRRRKQKDPATSSLSKVFITADEHHLLNYKIASGRITAMLKSRGMYPRDCFAAIDRDRDGLLNYEDLKRGLEWLDLKLDQVLLIGFMKELDKDRDGFINLEEFKGAVDFKDDGTLAQNAAAFNNGMPLPPMPSDDKGKKDVQIPQAVLAAIKVKVKQITKFAMVWNSQGSMSRDKASVWEPVVGGGAFRQNKGAICLGHFCGVGYDNPNKDGRDRLCLEVTDTTGSWVGGSSWLPHVLDRYMPHPARFRLAWSVTHGSNPFYAWEPVPPGEEFVALGFIGTKVDKKPDVTCMRCVARDWCKPSGFLQKVWDDSGSGGRQGSIWVFNTMNLVGFVSGSDPPRKKGYDLKSRRFFLKEYSDTSAQNVAPAGGGYSNPK
jgi:Ca2+-binding EF-hand superfamily protein